MSDLNQYSTYTPAADEEFHSSYEATRVLDGATRITMSNGAMIDEALGVASFDSRTDINTFDKSDWRSTATNRNGTPTIDIQEDSIVSVNGVRGKVQSLVEAGELVKNDKGEFVLAPPKEIRLPSEAERLEAAQHEAVFPGENVRAINDALSVLDGSSVEVMAHLGIASALGSMSNEDLVRKFSEKSGRDPVESAARVELVRSQYQTQADDYIINRAGLNREELDSFHDFCREPKNRGALSAAMERQVYQRKLDGYQPLVKAYYAGTVPSAQSMSDHGLETKKAHDGKDLVWYQGMWVSSKVAAKQGWI